MTPRPEPGQVPDRPQPGRRPRVVHVITMLELGGAQQNTLHTVRHLDRRRFDVALLVGPGGLLDGEARAIADLTLLTVPALVREVDPARDLAAVRQLVEALRRLSPDVVHTHSSKAGILGRWAARVARVPVVVHSVHGFGFTPGQPAPVRAAFRLAERLSRPATDHFVVVSRANLAEGVRLGLFARERVTLIRSGIDLAEFAGQPGEVERDRSEVRAELGLGDRAELVGMVSCLKPQKDPLLLAEVAARVAAARPSAHFALAGDGELRPALEARIGALGLGGRFHLLGWRRDVPRLMRSFDLLLHASRWEGLPRVLPQAMAAGLAVVATAVDGAPEAVQDGDSGFLAQPGDATALAAGVIRLLAEPALRARFGRRGRELVPEFDVRRLVPAQEALYERLLAEHASRARQAA